MDHRIWAWPHQDFSHLANYLFAFRDRLIYRGSVYSHEVEKLKGLLERSGPEVAFEQARKKKIGEVITIVDTDKIRAVDHVPLLAEHLVRIRFLDAGGRERSLRMKLSANDDSAATLFEELREYVAPQSAIVEEQASRWTSIRGPLLSLIFGGGYIFLLAFASTADAKTWQEQGSDFYAIIGWVLRTIGPFWLASFGAVWIGISALLLAYRLRRPPTTRVWRP
jgi:hypothetical protein